MSTLPTAPRRHPVVSAVVAAVLAFVAYAGAILLERLISYPHGSRATVWWSAGWGVALACRLNLWAAVGVWLAEFVTVAFLNGEPAWLAFATAVGNAGETLLGGWLLRRGVARWELRRLRDLARLLAAVAVCPIPMILSQVPVTFVAGWLAADTWPLAAAQWYGNDAVAVLYMVPLVNMVLARPGATWAAVRVRPLECLALTAGLVAVTAAAYGTASGHFLPGLSAAALPFLAWVALRFDPRVAVAALLVYAAVVCLCVARRLDPFPPDVPSAFPYLHLLFLVVGLSTLLLAALASDRAAALRRAREGDRWQGLGALAGELAHELNNQLTVILGAIEMVSGRLPVDPVSKRLMVSAEGAARKVAQLASDVLAFSGQSVRTASRRVDLAEVIRDAVADAGRPVRVELPPGASPVDLFADPALVRLAVRNVLANALEATAGGGAVAVELGEATVAEDETAEQPLALSAGRYRVVRVSDTGKAMPAEAVAQLFDPFGGAKFTGRGLRLAAVTGALRQANGGVRVRVGEGTVVELLFPVPDPVTSR